MNKRQEPRLRFKGFAGAWEDRMLGKVADVRDGTHDSPIYQNQGIPLVTSKNLTENGLDFSNVSLISQEDYEEINKRSKVESGDILLGLIGTIGKPVLVKSGGYAIKNVGLIKELLEVKNEFLLLLLQSNIFETYVSRKNTGNTQKFLALDGLRSFEFLAPSLPEQTAIGNFFRRLDSQIAESRAVLEKSRQLKKAMLAKMFPANGEKIPKIRFKGFEGEWERKKLGEIAFKVKEKNIAYQYAETFTNSAEFGIISQQDFFDKSISNSENIGGYYVVQPDDFVYNPRISSFAPVGPIKRNKLGRTGVMSPLYYVFRLNDEIKPSYLEQYFEGNQWHHFMYLNGDTGARSDRFSIKNDVFAEMPISFPANKNEQTAIGNFFRQLDETIALQSAEVEKLNQLKKGLLAAMLV